MTVEGLTDKPLLPVRVIVTNSRGASSDSMAETALTLTLGLARDAAADADVFVIGGCSC